MVLRVFSGAIITSFADDVVMHSLLNSRSPVFFWTMIYICWTCKKEETPIGTPWSMVRGSTSVCVRPNQEVKMVPRDSSFVPEDNRDCQWTGAAKLVSLRLVSHRLVSHRLVSCRPTRRPLYLSGQSIRNRLYHQSQVLCLISNSLSWPRPTPTQPATLL